MNTKEYARIFKALSHPNRLEIFMDILAASEKSYEGVCDFKGGKGCYTYIADMQKIFATIGAPAISHHIKELVHHRKKRSLPIRRFSTGLFVFCWSMVCRLSTVTLRVSMNTVP